METARWGGGVEGQGGDRGGLAETIGVDSKCKIMHEVFCGVGSLHPGERRFRFRGKKKGLALYLTDKLWKGHNTSQKKSRTQCVAEPLRAVRGFGEGWNKGAGI